MSHPLWQGVIPAITTPFTDTGEVDLPFLARHAAWMLDAGCTGIVALGSLGEGGTLDRDERAAVLRTLVESVGPRAPVFAAVAALSTREAARQAQEAQRLGCRGLMVLPPYVYRGSEHEMHAHVDAVVAATGLSCMLYNNPIAYGTDFTPSQIAAFAERHANLHAVKESSADARRITAIRMTLGDRLAILVGVDDLIVEGVAAGATGWIAGVVNALPRESVELFTLAQRAASGDALALTKAHALYRRLLPLLRMDTVPEFVHLIKMMQAEAGMGSERVRPPRLPLRGERYDHALVEIRRAMGSDPRQ